MKRIEAIIKPFKLHEVREALADLGVSGLIASEVEGCGRWTGQPEGLLDRPHTSDYIPKIKLEVVVADALSGPVSLAIIEAARTGSLDDGHIFTSQVIEAFSIGAPEAADENARLCVAPAL